MAVATGNKYHVYVRKLKEGNKREIEERLTCLPDKEFRAMFEEVTGKELPTQLSRHQQISELIFAFEGMTA